MDEVQPEIPITLSEPEQGEVVHKDEVVEPDVVQQTQIEETVSQAEEVQAPIQQV